MRRSNALEESSDLKGQCERERKSDVCLESFSGVTGKSDSNVERRKIDLRIKKNLSMGNAREEVVRNLSIISDNRIIGKENF